jgi:hypothetical protein
MSLRGAGASMGEPARAPGSRTGRPARLHERSAPRSVRRRRRQARVGAHARLLRAHADGLKHAERAAIAKDPDGRGARGLVTAHGGGGRRVAPRRGGRGGAGERQHSSNGVRVREMHAQRPASSRPADGASSAEKTGEAGRCGDVASLWLVLPTAREYGPERAGAARVRRALGG